MCCALCAGQLRSGQCADHRMLQLDKSCNLLYGTFMVGSTLACLVGSRHSGVFKCSTCIAARLNLSSRDALISRITLLRDSCCSAARRASFTVKLSHSRKSVLSWPVPQPRSVVLEMPVDLFSIRVLEGHAAICHLDNQEAAAEDVRTLLTGHACRNGAERTANVGACSRVQLICRYETECVEQRT